MCSQFHPRSPIPLQAMPVYSTLFHLHSLCQRRGHLTSAAAQVQFRTRDDGELNSPATIRTRQSAAGATRRRFPFLFLSTGAAWLAGWVVVARSLVPGFTDPRLRGLDRRRKATHAEQQQRLGETGFFQGTRRKRGYLTPTLKTGGPNQSVWGGQTDRQTEPSCTWKRFTHGAAVGAGRRRPEAKPLRFPFQPQER